MRVSFLAIFLFLFSAMCREAGEDSPVSDQQNQEDVSQTQTQVSAAQNDSQPGVLAAAVKSGEQILLSFSAATGIGLDQANIAEIYSANKDLLPIDNQVSALTPVSALAIMKLAAEFCKAYAEKADNRQKFGLDTGEVLNSTHLTSLYFELTRYPAESEDAEHLTNLVSDLQMQGLTHENIFLSVCTTILSSLKSVRL